MDMSCWSVILEKTIRDKRITGKNFYSVAQFPLKTVKNDLTSFVSITKLKWGAENGAPVHSIP